LPPLLDAHQRVPAQRDDRAEQVRRFQAPVAEDDHGPAGGHRCLQVGQDPQPVRVPGVLLATGQDGPGDGDADALDDHADAQDVETLAEVGDVDGQGEVASRPHRQDPPQQGGEAGGDVEVPAFLALVGAGLGLGLLVELREPLADGEVAAAEVLGEEEGDRAEAGDLGEDHAEGVEGEDGDGGCGQIGEAACQVVLPGRKLREARHGDAPRRGGSHATPSLADFPVAPPPVSSFLPSFRPGFIL
jgi:hypothetical protein